MWRCVFILGCPILFPRVGSAVSWRGREGEGGRRKKEGGREREGEKERVEGEREREGEEEEREGEGEGGRG